ncbi:MAG: dihydrolipoamide acetyltransferase family protein [Desulfuromonadaceae bacterium]|nr:dihydrolipoamide acetyltransferase family protein [Desulfuromonadaceae bacterium]
MATEIIMPKLSDTMTEGLFACWKKNIGDHIERGDIIGEVETDKATMELEAFASGILIKTMVNGGENVPVGTVLGLIGEVGEIAESATATPSGAPTPEARSSTPEIEEISSPPVVPEAAISHREKIFETEMTHEKASPLVRRLAREQGIDLEQVQHSGPEGRITLEDFTAFAGQQQEKHDIAAPSITPSAEMPGASMKDTMPTSMRQAIATTVTRSWQTIPHFSVTIEIDMGACREIIRELKEDRRPISYNALVIKACASTLLKFPRLCSNAIADSKDVHINFAVSTSAGLQMPAVRQCQRLSIAEIQAESSRLAEKSRSGRLTSEEMAEGSFSVSNLGMYGVDEFTALIMPGQTGILAVGAVIERPVVRNGQLAVAATMRVTLSSDHRAVDGAYAASFLAELRSTLEKPVSLLM